MTSRIFLIFTIILFCFFSALFSETVISGLILDDRTNEPLIAANVQITGTYRGTISNEDGFFVITIEQNEALLNVSYIGYESKTIRVSYKDEGREVKIYLKPIILEGETITVIAEDPGMQIMREVIKRKKIWREKLSTYQAKAYSRIVLENDSGIVSLAESTSETFWDREKGSREVIKTKEQSSNLSERYNMAFASYIPNFYDDDIEIGGYSVIGPTHPDAMDYYRFKLEKVTRMDKQKVYWIKVIPESKLQPTFNGKLAVLDSVFALLEAELIPSESVRLPMPIQSWDVYYTQQFRNYGQEFWLPVDLRMSGSIKIGFTGLQFPKIGYKRIASLSDYQVNIPLPDSLYKEDDFLIVDSIALAETKHIRAIPLTSVEDTAYTELDSTMTLEKAFKPSGFLADMLEISSDEEADTSGRGIFSYFEPSLWYNRVDGLHIGVNIDEPLTENFSIRMGAAYKTGLETGGYHIRLRYRTGDLLPLRFDAAYSSNTELRYDSQTYSRAVASILPLFALDDYFDYYWSKSVKLETASRIRSIRTDIALKYHYQEHTSLEKQTDFNLVFSNFKQRSNPAITEGILRSLEFSIAYGRDFTPFGVIGQKRIAFHVEHTLPSDFDFTTYRLDADWRINTFLTRRLLPNALDLHLVLGTVRGELPVQRFASLDAAFYPFGPFGVFRSLLGRPYEGEKYAALFWEHNFRTVPFELIGFDYLVDKGIGLIIYGASGRTWISDMRRSELNYNYIYTDEVHNELGIAVNGILGLIRLDFTQHIGTNLFYVGFGMNRFF